MFEFKLLYNIKIRKEPILKDNNIVGLLKKDDTIEVEYFKDCWMKHSKGWSLYMDEMGMLIDSTSEYIEELKSYSKSDTYNDNIIKIFNNINDISLYQKIDKFYSVYNSAKKYINTIDIAIDSGKSYDECIKDSLLNTKLSVKLWDELNDIIDEIKLVFSMNFDITLNNMKDFNIYVDNYISYMNDKSISNPINTKVIESVNSSGTRNKKQKNTENNDDYEYTEEDYLDEESLKYLSEDYNYNDNSLTTKIKDLRGIFGMPYQYDHVSDPSYDKKNTIGWKFYSTYVTKAPLLYLTPCSPKFMPGFSKNDKNNMLTAFLGNDTGALDLFTNKAKGGTRYFATKFDLEDYYKRFDTLARALAIYLGIGDVTVKTEGYKGGKLSSFMSQNYINSGISTILGGRDTIAYFVDSIDSITESHTNETTNSKLESVLNAQSDLVNEINFVAGGLGTSWAQSFIEGVGNVASTAASHFGVLGKRLGEGIMSIAHGGKLVIPEIWSDSNFSFSGGNTFVIKLTSQNPCKLGWFFDIGLPYMSLVAMTAPHSIGNNSYDSPFLVRAYCRSSLSIDMGIISSLDIKKGDTGKWTVDGLPTEVEISVEIKNLYSSLSTSNSIGDFSSNALCMDYIANIAGVNINKPSFERSVSLFITGLKNAFNPIMFTRYLGIRLEEIGNNIINNTVDWFR